MPLYEYKCNSCDYTFEVFHKTTEVIKRCERCSSVNVTRLLYTSSLKFNGAGFYREGFSSKLKDS
jgi:putative FmdB family regulatory protein